MHWQNLIYYGSGLEMKTVNKASWTNTVLSWIAKKLGYSLKPITKSSTETNYQKAPSSQNISGKRAHNLWLEHPTLGEFPISFTTDSGVARTRENLLGIGRRIAHITGSSLTLHQQTINGPKTSISFSAVISVGTWVQLIYQDTKGKLRCRQLPYKGHARLLEHLVINFRNTPVSLRYYVNDVKPSYPFFFQKYRDGVIVNG